MGRSLGSRESSEEVHSRITLSHTAFFNVRVSPTRATSLKHTRHVPARRAHLPARDPGGPAAFTACSIGFASKLLLAVCGTNTPGAAERQGSSHATADRRAACHLWHGAAAAAAAAAAVVTVAAREVPSSRLFARSPLAGMCETAHTRERCHCRQDASAAARGSQPLLSQMERLLHAAG